jgi:SAM-dependent methyltransferase
MIKEKVKQLLAREKCNLCQSKIYKFTPANDGYIENLQKKGFPIPVTDFETFNYQAYKCPVCQSNDRDRLMALYIQGFITDRKTGDKVRLLDIAPADSLRKYLQGTDGIIYRSADLYATDVDDNVDIQDMHIYKENSYDLVICSHVLEHVPDDQRSLREMYRILRPGGSCLLMVPIPLGNYKYDEELGSLSTEERERRFGQDDHMRLYTKKVFEERIRAAGFALQNFTIEDSSDDKAGRYGIGGRAVLYVGKK